MASANNYEIDTDEVGMLHEKTSENLIFEGLIIENNSDPVKRADEMARASMADECAVMYRHNKRCAC